jgi:hypothetical protein
VLHIRADRIIIIMKKQLAVDFYRQKSMKSITNQQGKHHLWASFIMARCGE